MCLLENWHCFPGGSVVNNPPASIGDAGSIPGPGRSPGEGIATHSSVLTWENPMDRGGLQSMESNLVTVLMKLALY